MISIALFLTLHLRQTDPQAVLDAAKAKLSNAKNAVGTVVFPQGVSGTAPMKMEFRFSKPTLFVTILGTRETWCDGKTLAVLDAKTKEYQYFPAGDDAMPRFAWGFDAFFPRPKDAYTFDHPVAGTFAEKPAVIAEFHGTGLRTTVHVAFDPQTSLPLGFTLGVGDEAHDFRYEGVKLDVPGAKADFNWKPTPEWHKHEPMADKLLRVGTKAPDFTLSTPDGKTIRLSQALAGKKGLLLNFWFVDCNPCRQEFPHLQSMFPGLEDQGFGYLSVNNGDKADRVSKFVKEFGYTFPIALNGSSESDVVAKYGVAAFPTNLVIAPDRTITARFVGFDEDGLKEAIRKLGLKLD